MSTLESIKSELQEIIADSNATTGGNATTVRDGVNALISGFGGGSGGGSASLNIHYGDTAPEDTSMLWCKCAEPSEVLVTPKLLGEGQFDDTFLTTLPAGWYDMKTATIGTKIYLIGGYKDGAVSNEISVFDTKTNDLSVLSTELTTRLSMGIGVVGTKIYLFGGQSVSADKVSIFDTETNELATISTTLPTDWYNMGVGVVGTKIYLFGGYCNGYLNTIRLFDTETETLTTLSATLSVARSPMGVGVVGTKIYVLGGSVNNGRETRIDVFDTETNTISVSTTYLPNNYVSRGVGVVGTKIHMFGGYATSVTNVIQVFDTETNEVTTLSTTLPTACRYIGTGVVGNKIYLFGGYASSRLDTILKFVVKLGLEQNKLQLQTSVSKNFFNILNGGNEMEVGVNAVYLGNSNNEGELVDSYLYQNGAWTQI